jgi:hypothetical protein
LSHASRESRIFLRQRVYTNAAKRIRARTAAPQDIATPQEPRRQL